MPRQKTRHNPIDYQLANDTRVAAAGGIGDWLATGATDRKIILRRGQRRDMTLPERQVLAVAQQHLDRGEISIITRRTAGQITYIAERVAE
jgi:hypothetical protein